MATTHELLLSHGEQNDGTNYPFWAIVTKSGLGGHVWHAGPWFNRKDATDHLKACHYRYPKTAIVYCFSAHMSWHLKEMYENARNEQREQTPKDAATRKIHWGKALADPEIYEAMKAKGLIEWVGGNQESGEGEQ